MSIKGAVRAIPLAKLVGASMKVLFVQDSYPLIGFGESLSAGVQALMMAARENGTQASQEFAMPQSQMESLSTHSKSRTGTRLSPS